MSRHVELTDEEAEHAKRLGLGPAAFRYYREDALVPGNRGNPESDPYEAQRKLLYDRGFYPQAWALSWGSGSPLMLKMFSDQAADLLEENGYSEEAALFRKTDDDQPEWDEFSV